MMKLKKKQGNQKPSVLFFIRKFKKYIYDRRGVSKVFVVMVAGVFKNILHLFGEMDFKNIKPTSLPSCL